MTEQLSNVSVVPAVATVTTFVVMGFLLVARRSRLHEDRRQAAERKKTRRGASRLHDEVEVTSRKGLRTATELRIDSAAQLESLGEDLDPFDHVASQLQRGGKEDSEHVLRVAPDGAQRQDRPATLQELDDMDI